MRFFETRLSDSTDCDITLSHDPEDPSSWIVRKWKKRLFGKRCELSLWFATKEQAETYARTLIEDARKQRRKAA
ncbi:MAG: hypothetical protein JXA28_10790 [Bacteroidetes bacterium]|nr:hypothetical protein [Bacteroidota bacterium]